MNNVRANNKIDAIDQLSMSRVSWISVTIHCGFLGDYARAPRCLGQFWLLGSGEAAQAALIGGYEPRSVDSRWLGRR